VRRQDYAPLHSIRTLLDLGSLVLGLRTDAPKANAPRATVTTFAAHRPTTQRTTRGAVRMTFDEILTTSHKLTELHRFMVRVMGDQWPERSARWKAVIEAKAKAEGTRNLEAAIAMAKEFEAEPDGRGASMQVLAAALEMP
jgi:hypothetical protein